MPSPLSRLSPGLSLCLLAAAVLAGCGSPPIPEPGVTLDQLASLSFGPAVEQYQEQADVKVSVSAAKLDDEWSVVRGVFTPGETGYHLYSKDLPMEGIEQIGRPTFIEIAEGGIQTGSLLANQEPHDLTQYDLTLPVYPEGPVTLYRLVRVKKGAASLSVALTYMSCSDTLCNAPVQGAVETVTLP